MDKSGCTPLWYCLALKRWTMAEYLITSGVRVSVRRAIPGLYSKRSFTLCRSPPDLSGHLDPPAAPVDRSRRRPSVLLRNNSSQMVGLLSPGSEELLHVYRNPPSPPLPSPPCVGFSKGVLGTTTLNDSGFSASEGDRDVTTPVEVGGGGRRRNLRYLLSLIHYASLKVREALLIHSVACSCLLASCGQINYYAHMVFGDDLYHVVLYMGKHVINTDYANFQEDDVNTVSVLSYVTIRTCSRLD